MNNLTDISAALLATILHSECGYPLKELYVHWNLIKGKGGKAIF